ncbi:MAG: VWA domain-containing protein, partial [Thermoguttaceae bacterium]|nr:VWA domain-containing protein [Thermoguttaceae bacterium]
MRQGYLHACVVLDSSESMNALKDAVQFSLNEFLGRLRNRMEWKKRLDVYKFSDRCEQIVDELDLNQISYDALHAAIAVENQGASAMNDAICHAIDALGEKLAAMPERERPETVVFAVVTDGRDNASKKFTLADVWKRVTCQSYVFSWKFEYLAMKANELRENCRLDETPIYPVINEVEEVERLEENDTVTELESESQAIYDESEDYDPANDAEQAQDSQIVKEPGFSDEGLYDAEDGSPIELESTSTLGNAEVESELEENLAAVSDEISQTDEPNAAETETDGSAAQFEQPPQEATPPDYSAIFFEPQVDLYRHEFRTLQSLSEILAGSDIDEYSTLKNDGATAKDAGAQTENKEEPDGAADQEPE